MKCPCLNCNRRGYKCHGVCEAYQLFHEWNATRSKRIREQKSAEHITYEVSKVRVDPASEKWRQT